MHIYYAMYNNYCTGLLSLLVVCGWGALSLCFSAAHCSVSFCFSFWALSVNETEQCWWLSSWNHSLHDVIYPSQTIAYHRFTPNAIAEFNLIMEDLFNIWHTLFFLTSLRQLLSPRGTMTHQSLTDSSIWNTVFFLQCVSTPVRKWIIFPTVPYSHFRIPNKYVHMCNVDDSVKCTSWHTAFWLPNIH